VTLSIGLKLGLQRYKKENFMIFIDKDLEKAEGLKRREGDAMINIGSRERKDG